MSEIVRVEKLGKEKGYMRKKISLINPEPRNVLVETQSLFTREEVSLAKAKNKLYSIEKGS